MPIYEYECPKCGHIFEDWCKSVADGEAEHLCPTCNTSAPRIISHTSFALKGGGWYATEYGTMKGKEEKKNSSTSSKKTTPATKEAPKDTKETAKVAKDTSVASSSAS